MRKGEEGTLSISDRMIIIVVAAAASVPRSLISRSVNCRRLLANRSVASDIPERSTLSRSNASGIPSARDASAKSVACSKRKRGRTASPGRLRKLATHFSQLAVVTLSTHHGMRSQAGCGVEHVLPGLAGSKARHYRPRKYAAFNRSSRSRESVLAIISRTFPPVCSLTQRLMRIAASADTKEMWLSAPYQVLHVLTNSGRAVQC